MEGTNRRPALPPLPLSFVCPSRRRPYTSPSSSSHSAMDNANTRPNQLPPPHPPTEIFPESPPGGSSMLGDPPSGVPEERMGSRREKGLSASWDTNDIFLFCDICIAEIEAGNRPTTHFNKEGWKNLIVKFKEGSGKLYDRAQLKNKWDQMKKDWKLWRELKRNETGLGWNPIKKTIDATDEWWAEKLQALPNAKKFRYGGIAPELEEKLDRMFSSVVATGEDVWMPSSGVLPSEVMPEQIASDDDDNMATDTGAGGSRSGAGGSRSGAVEESTTRQSKRKSTTKTQLVDYVKELVDTARDKAPPSRAPTIKEAFDEIAKYPDIYNDMDFYDFATEYIIDKGRREAFMSCPEDRKVWWLNSRYQRSKQ